MNSIEYEHEIPMNLALIEDTTILNMSEKIEGVGVRSRAYIVVAQRRFDACVENTTFRFFNAYVLKLDD